MPKEDPPAHRRADSMVNIWVGKELGPELDDFARREARLTGHTTTKTAFARDLFLWAVERYREAGSLAKLKKRHPVDTEAELERQVFDSETKKGSRRSS